MTNNHLRRCCWPNYDSLSGICIVSFRYKRQLSLTLTQDRKPKKQKQKPQKRIVLHKKVFTFQCAILLTLYRFLLFTKTLILRFIDVKSSTYRKICLQNIELSLCLSYWYQVSFMYIKLSDINLSFQKHSIYNKSDILVIMYNLQPSEI